MFCTAHQEPSKTDTLFADLFAQAEGLISKFQQRLMLMRRECFSFSVLGAALGRVEAVRWRSFFSFDCSATVLADADAGRLFESPFHFDLSFFTRAQLLRTTENCSRREELDWSAVFQHGEHLSSACSSSLPIETGRRWCATQWVVKTKILALQTARHQLILQLIKLGYACSWRREM